MPHAKEVGLGPGNIVLDGDPTPPRRRYSSPHVSADVYCSQTAAWVKMPLGTEVSLGPGYTVHTVLDGELCYMGTLLPPQKGGIAAPLYG